MILLYLFRFDLSRSFHCQVAFIGISNWALDPAKMNRGILVSRGVPDKDDLIHTAQGICSGNEDVERLMRSTVKILADGYYRVYQEQEREFFGLRDFYSLVKMVHRQVCESKAEPTREVIVQAVIRNFGVSFGEFKAAEVFLTSVYPDLNAEMLKPSKESVMEAIRQKEESRYILLLTTNNAALNIIQEQVKMCSFIC